MAFGYYGGWAPYVPVAERRRKATPRSRAEKKGKPVSPVVIEGPHDRDDFLGQGLVRQSRALQDYANRLPRGRTYVRNGSVIDLQIARARSGRM